MRYRTNCKLHHTTSVDSLTPPQFCPVCGNACKTRQTAAEDFWGALGEQFDLEPATLRRIFLLWDPKLFPNFVEFLHGFTEDADGTEVPNSGH